MRGRKNLIPHRRVDPHRRILFQDMMEYNLRMDRQRLAAFKKLAEQAEELDMGY